MGNEEQGGQKTAAAVAKIAPATGKLGSHGRRPGRRGHHIYRRG